MSHSTFESCSFPLRRRSMSSGKQGDDGSSKSKLSNVDLVENNDDSFVTSILSLYYSFRKSLFWILFGLHQDASMSLPVFGLMILVESYQWCSFVFFPQSDIPWDSSRWTSWIYVSADWSANFLGQNVEGVYAALVLVAFIPLACAFALFSGRVLQLAWPMAAFRIFLVFCYNILFFPIVGSLFRVIFGCLDMESSKPSFYFPEMQCGDTQNIVLLILSVAAILFFFPVMIVFAVAHYEINPNQRIDNGDRIAADSRSSGRGDVLYTVLRVAVSVFFVLFAQFTSHRWPLALCLTLVGGLLLRYDFYHLPYYNMIPQTLVVYRNSLILWGGLCMLITNITGSNSRGATYLFIIGGLVPVIGAILFVRMRSDQIVGCSSDLLTTPALVQLKVTLLMRAGSRKHNLDVMWEALTDEQRIARRALWTQVEQVYTLGLARFKDDPLLHLHFSTFYYFHVGNKPLAHREASSALRLDCPFDVDYFIFLYRTLSETVESTEHSADVSLYIEFKDLSISAESASRLAARSLVEFWSELLRGSPNVERLFRLSSVARAAMISANTTYERLLEINPTSVQVLRTFGGFVLDFLGDISASSQMLHRADEVEEQRSSMARSDGVELKILAMQKTNLDVYDERNAVVSISLDSSNFAKIVSVNSAARRIFGYSSNAELLGQSINAVIPEPVRSVHDEILQAFLYRNEPRILNSTLVVLAVHKQGHVIPLDANIRWADTVASRIIAVMAPVPTDDEQLMYDKDSDQVTYATLNAYSYFGFSREMIVAKEVVLSLLFPHLSLDLTRTAKGRRTREELVEQAQRPRGLILAARNHSDNTLFLVRFWTYTLQMHTVSASVARISRKVEEEHLRKEENVLCFTKEDLNGGGALSKDIAHLFSVLAARKQKRGANSGNDHTGDEEQKVSVKKHVPVLAASPVHAKHGYSDEDETEESVISPESSLSRANGDDEDEDEDEDPFDEDDLEPSRAADAARSLSQTRVSLLKRSASVHGQSLRALPTVSTPNAALTASGQKPGGSPPMGSKAQQRLAASASLFQVSGRAVNKRVEERSGQVASATAASLSTSTSAALVPQKEVTTSDLTVTNLKGRLEGDPSKAGPGRTNTTGFMDAEVRGTGHEDGGDDLISEQGANRSTAGSGASSSIDGGHTVMGNRAVIAFVKNRVDESHKVVTMSRNLGHVVIALIGASLLATYFLVDAAITDNNVALSAQTLACHRRHLAMNTGLLLPSALSLTSMGFYETSRYAGYLQRLVASIESLRSLNAQLFHALPPTRASRDFMFVPSLALVTRHPDGKVVQLKVNLKEYVELFVRQATAVATTPLESLTPEASADLFSLTRNGMETAPVAFERAAVYYQDYVDQIYGDINRIIIAILISAIAVLVFYLVFSVYRTVVYCERHSEDVVLLLLSLPRSVVRLIQRRYVTTLKNQGEEEEETLDLNDAGDKRVAIDNDFDHMSSSDVSSNSGGLSDDGGNSGTESAPDTTYPPNSNDKNPRLARNRVAISRKSSLIEYAQSRRIRIALRFGLLLALTVIYVVVVDVQVDTTRLSNLDATRDIAASTQRQFALVNARYAARKYMVGLDTQVSHDACLAAYETLNRYISALAYGDQELGLKGNPSPAVAAQLFSNPCVLPPDTMVTGPTERAAYSQKCSTYRNGFAKRGAQELLIVSKLATRVLASDMYRESLAAGLTKNANSTTVPYQPTDPFYLAAQKVLDDYISILRDLSEPIMTIATDLYRDDAHRTNEQLRTFLLILFICGCIVFATGHLFIFSPVFHALFMSVRTSHGLLFAIPPDVATKLPQLTAFLAESASTEERATLQSAATAAAKSVAPPVA